MIKIEYPGKILPVAQVSSAFQMSYADLTVFELVFGNPYPEKR